MAKKNRNLKTSDESDSPLSDRQKLWTEQFWACTEPSSLLVRVRVTPRGGKNSVDGQDILSDGSRVLKIRTNAVPQDGEANDAVRKILAKTFDLPSSSIMLESGATSRIKIFRIMNVQTETEEKLLGL